MAQVEELTYDLVFNFRKKMFTNFNDSMAKVKDSFIKITALSSALQVASFGLAKSIADTNDELLKMSKRLNIDTADFQKLQLIAQDNGASVEDLRSSLQELSKAQEDIKIGKGDLQAWGELGINPSSFKDTNSLMLAISDRISNISDDSKKIQLMERIGINRKLLQTLENGSKSIINLGNEFQSLGGIVSKESLSIANDFQASLFRTKTITSGIMNKIGVELQKTSITIMNKINAIFANKESREKFEKLMTSIFDVANKVFNTIFNIVQRVSITFIRLTDVLGGLENTVIILAGAFTILKAKMLASFILPIAVVTGLYLLLEDFISFLEGKDSIFSDLFGFFGVEGKDVINIIGKIRESIISLFDGAMFDNFLAGFIAMWESIKKKIEEIKQSIKDAFTFEMPNFSMPDFVDGMMDSMSNAMNSITNNNSVQSVANTNNNQQKTINVDITGAGGANNGDAIDTITNYFNTQFTNLWGNE